MQNNPNPAPSVLHWWTPKQIAETLQVTPRTVQRWITSGALPVHRFGRAVRISTEDFETFIANGRAG